MPSTRPAGFVLIACAAAALLLLLAHPGGDAHEYLGLVKMEAAQQGRDALVHGGFILLLPLIVTGQAQLARRMGLDRFTVLLGLVLFCAGSAFLAASLMVDGLLVPQMASRLVAMPAPRIEAARPAFLLATTAVRLLMPMGLGLQALGAAALAFAALALKHGIALGGLGVMLLTATGIAVTLGAQPMVLMAAIVLVAVVWNALAGALLLA
jgi:hypothetical protein